jgi:CHAT domain-containing protein/Flp pilus assembly protein TadD
MRWSGYATAFGVTALALGIVLAGVISTAALALEVGPTAEALEEQIWELRLQASYAEATEVARELVALRKGDPDAAPFEIADAEGLVEMLEQMSEFPGTSQRELAAADSLAEVGDTYSEEGRYAEAAAAVMRQLEIRRRLLGNTHPDLAFNLNYLAYLLHAQGDYAGAEPLFREALAMRRELLGDEHPDVARSLNNLAVLLYSQGDYVGAEPLYREALAMRRKILGDEHPEVAVNLNNLASLLYLQADYASAEPLFREALAMQRKLLGNEHPDVAQSLNNLALLLHAQGDLVGAEPLYREALAMTSKSLGDEHPHVAISLSNLAQLLHAQGDLAGAESLFREALAMWRKLLGDEHPNVAVGLNNLAAVFRDQGNYAGAEPLLRDALAMHRQLLGDEHPHVATGLNNLATDLEAQCNYMGAEPLYREALAMRRRLLGDEHPDVATSLSNLAGLLYAQGAHAGAEPLLAEAARVYDAARLRAGAGLKRAAFQESPYPRLASVRLALGRTDEAWPAAEKAHARSLADLLVAAEERELSSPEAAREDSLKRVLGTLERELAAYREAATSDTTGEVAGLAEAARNALLGVESEWSAFQQEIVAKHPVTEGRAFPLAREQSALSQETAIIGWLDVGTGKGEREARHYESWCYAIRNSGPVAWERVGTSVDSDDSRSPSDRTRSFRDRLASPASPDAVVTRESRDLWGERIAPLLAALEGVDNLIVIPSGAMLGVPVEVLVDNEGVSAGETYAVSYVPSATLHAWLAERANGDVSSGTLLVGDPPYNPAHLAAMHHEEDVLLTLAELSPGAETLRSALTGNADALRALPRLHGTRDEVAAVAVVSEPFSLLLGPEASEQELVRLAESGELGEFGTIHIATHALVDDKQPERSALVLSQVELPDPLEAAMAGTRIYDGLVTAKEIVREWDLNADLVTLSACETGLGKAVMGEGYVGFAHAFLQAGARSLLVSLWKVEDTATSLLMRRFYENWRGEYADERNGRTGEPMTKAYALQEAKRWLRQYTDEYGNRPYEHPYYWSAFVLIGDRS